jgi:hypothetical protein
LIGQLEIKTLPKDARPAKSHQGFDNRRSLAISARTIGPMAMYKLMTIATAVALLLSLTPAPVAAQEINILGPGKGWKLQPQRGPDGQNVYSYDCATDFKRISHHRVSHAAGRMRMVGRQQ